MEEKRTENMMTDEESGIEKVTENQKNVEQAANSKKSADEAATAEEHIEENEGILEEIVNDLFQDRNLRGQSANWANWMAQLTFTTCKYCVKQHGTIVDISVLDNKDEVEAHDNCRCVYVPMRTKKAGSATEMGYNGADAQLFYLNRLPDYYIGKKEARKNGWVKWKGNLADVLPGKMIGGDIYINDDGKLPSAVGRIWYEADINYGGGYRNLQRILYSSDGLLFATYDHYETFYEITK